MENRIYATPGQFGAPLPHHHDGGTWRALACLPRRPETGNIPIFGDAHRVLPESSWKPISFAGYKVPILNQGQHGSCVWHATCTAHRKSRLISGQTDYELSPTFGYALGNGNRDAGMAISDACDILTQQGNCLASEFPEGQIWKRQIPASAMVTSKRFRADKTYRLTSFEEAVSAILAGFMIVFDVFVGDTFSNLDKNGVAPAWPGRDGNHAQTADGVVFLPDGTPALEGINSWGTDWGLSGRVRYVKAHLAHQIDAFAVVSTVEDPQEKNRPPVAS